MSVTKKFFGKTPDGRDAYLYTMTNKSGACAAVTDYGAHLVSVCVPDRDGVLADVCLGFDSAEKYAVEGGSLGATVGRFANRIARGAFTLNGTEYRLFINNGPNTLHGGRQGFDKRLFTAEITGENGADAVAFTYVSPDMEENFPGEMKVTVTFSWDENNTLSILYAAKADRDTVVNLTNHAYWNLSGMKDATMLDQVLTVLSTRSTEVDGGLIPTGKILDISGTAMDLSRGVTVRSVLDRAGECAYVRQVNGLDFNYCLEGEGMRECASLKDSASGRVMRVLTTEPAIQAYSGQGLHTVGHGGTVYGPFAGVALETQHYPDSPNHPEFPTTVLRAGDEFRSETRYCFSVEA